ncbi:hypothetical protein FB566_2869 [Stackebrandtia endophytica]|uniref:Uncharacterized protein n=1 Tax=Stackebrandtia endophytica TaxID=1496996 RepID=A0A543AXK4_9ACTN|nr:hypothetical protein FB566_2869 [Stackebrandtia endophytica]
MGLQHRSAAQLSFDTGCPDMASLRRRLESRSTDPKQPTYRHSGDDRRIRLSGSPQDNHFHSTWHRRTPSRPIPGGSDGVTTGTGSEVFCADRPDLGHPPRYPIPSSGATPLDPASPLLRLRDGTSGPSISRSHAQSDELRRTRPFHVKHLAGSVWNGDPRMRAEGIAHYSRLSRSLAGCVRNGMKAKSAVTVSARCSTPRHGPI